MLASDLAALYQVETRVFNQAVKRNQDSNCKVLSAHPQSNYFLLPRRFTSSSILRIQQGISGSGQLRT